MRSAAVAVFLLAFLTLMRSAVAVFGDRQGQTRLMGAADDDDDDDEVVPSCEVGLRCSGDDPTTPPTFFECATRHGGDSPH
jgi:hypothetical protein